MLHKVSYIKYKRKFLHRITHNNNLMMTNSPIDDLFGNELDYIKRGISQLDLILACKDQRIKELDDKIILLNTENQQLKTQISKLRDVTTKLQMKLDQSEIVTISSLETQETLENFFNFLH